MIINELSIEQKAKAYDKAINIAKSKIKNDKDHVLYEEDIIDIFPILKENKESEEERTRNEIIAFVEQAIHRGGGTPIPEEQEAKWIAWLEKQGQTFTKRDVDDAYLKGICDAKHELEKQGEQKPAETQKGTNGNEREIPNSAWSEEDKRKLNRIYLILGQAADTHAYSTTCRLIGDKECVELQDFLKHLKDRYTWKPSEEQMEYLHKYAEQNNYDGAILTSLYKDLKQLKQL